MNADRRCLSFGITRQAHPGSASAEEHWVSSVATTATSDGRVSPSGVTADLSSASCQSRVLATAGAPVPSAVHDCSSSEPVSRVWCRRQWTSVGRAENRPCRPPPCAWPCPLHGRRDGTDNELPSTPPPADFSAAASAATPAELGESFGDSGEVFGDSEESGGFDGEPDESADATPCPLAIAAPIPSATANPPTRPTYVATARHL